MDEGGKRVSWVELPPQIAYRLTCVGAGIYLVGTRAFLRASPRVSGRS